MDAHEPHRMPPDWLELRDLRYFLAVAEELNFTRAAERLHIAQQALSTAIRNLETDLGMPLFTRSTRHVALTSAGEALLGSARHALEAAADAVDDVHRVAAGRGGRLVIGFSTAAGSVPRVREVIRQFSRAAPDVDVRLIEYDFTDPSAGLLTGGTQAAFVFGPLAGDELAAVTVLDEPRLLAMPSGHELAARASLTTGDLTGLAWLRVPGPDTAWRRFWFRHPLGEDRPGAEIRTADEWVPAIESGRGVAYTMPSVMANFPNTEIVTRPVEDLGPGTILLAWRAADRDPVLTSFLSAARETLADG